MAENNIQIIIDGNPIPFEMAAPLALKQTRGLDPFMFSVIMSDISKLPADVSSTNGVPVTIKFTTPGSSYGETATIDWKSWILVRVEPSKSELDTYVVTFADTRWRAMHRRISVSYNLKWPDGNYRQESLNGASPWNTADAIRNAASLFGFSEVLFDLPSGYQNTELPNNLGNSNAGGFAFATFGEVMGPMFESLEADPIIGFNGELIATARNGKGKIPQLKALPRVKDTASESINIYERPRTLRVGFEVMCENIIQKGGYSSSTNARTLDEPVNVMPSYQTARLGYELEEIDTEGNVAGNYWLPIHEEMSEYGYVDNDEFAADQYVAQRYFLDNIVPIPRESPDGYPIESQEAVLRHLWFDGALRNCWRSYWRVKYPSDGNENTSMGLRSMARIQLGRLTVDGGVRARGVTYGSWSEEFTFGMPVVQRGDPFRYEYSKNHDYDPERPSPFIAQWVADTGGELIFRLVPPSNIRINQKRLFPAIFNTPLSYGNWIDISNDFDISVQEANGKFSTVFVLRVMVAGRLIAEDTRNGFPDEIQNRALIRQRPLYDDGGMESLDLKAYSLTANYAYSNQQLLSNTAFDNWPSVLLNDSQIDEKMDSLVEQAKRQYESGEAGAIVTPGVLAPSLGIGTGASIAEMTIMVGNPDPHSITTHYNVMPNLPGFHVDPERKDGWATPAIAAE